jgi:hypothetical protein
LLVCRITADGVQHSENPLVSEDQWRAIEEFFAHEDLKVRIKTYKKKKGKKLKRF